jgi:hypothetical protein
MIKSICYFQVDTKNPNSGTVKSTVHMNNISIVHDLIKTNDTKYDLKFLPTLPGLYEINIYLNETKLVKGSPFIIKVEESSLNNQLKSINSLLNTNPPILHQSTPTPELDTNKKFQEAKRRHVSMHATINENNSSSLFNLPKSNFEKNIKIELTYLNNNDNQSNSSEECGYMIGDEVVLNVKIEGVDLNDKNKKIVLQNIHAQLSYIEENTCIKKLVNNHKLEALTNGHYQLKFTPTKAGNYFVIFMKDGEQIEGIYFL